MSATRGERDSVSDPIEIARVDVPIHSATGRGGQVGSVISA